MGGHLESSHVGEGHLGGGHLGRSHLEMTFTVVTLKSDGSGGRNGETTIIGTS